MVLWPFNVLSEHLFLVQTFGYVPENRNDGLSDHYVQPFEDSSNIILTTIRAIEFIFPERSMRWLWSFIDPSLAICSSLKQSLWEGRWGALVVKMFSTFTVRKAPSSNGIHWDRHQSEIKMGAWRSDSVGTWLMCTMRAWVQDPSTHVRCQVQQGATIISYQGHKGWWSPRAHWGASPAE